MGSLEIPIGPPNRSPTPRKLYKQGSLNTITLNGFASSLIARFGDHLRSLLRVGIRQLGRYQLNCQLVEFTGETKRRLVILVIHARTCIDPDVERLINRKEGRNRVWDCLARDLFPIHRKDASPTFGHTRSIVFEVKYDYMLAGGKRLRRLPFKAF